MVTHSKDRTLDRRFRGVIGEAGLVMATFRGLGIGQSPSIYFRGRTVRLSLSFTDGNKQDLAGFSLMFME